MIQRNLKIASTLQSRSELDPLFSIITDTSVGSILPCQLRAARGLLHWSRSQCASAVGISPETIKNIEYGSYSPQSSTCQNILRTFAENGVEFLNLINFRLNTMYGHDLGKLSHVAGAVLVLPVHPKDESSQ